MDIRRLSISFLRLEYEQNLWYSLQNAKLLEKLQLTFGRSLVGLLSSRARTLKVLDFAVSLYDESPGLPLPLLLVGLYDELEAMAGHNILEALYFKVNVDGYEKGNSSIIHNAEKALNLGGLLLDSFLYDLNYILSGIMGGQSLDKYLSHLSKFESIAFNFSASVLSSE